MATYAPLVLALNAGSSSLKFALLDLERPHRQRLRGRIERLGSAGATFLAETAEGAEGVELGRADYSIASQFLLDWLGPRLGGGVIDAVAHRIVHGGPRYRDHQRIDDEMLAELHRVVGFAPEHLPAAIDIVDACRARLQEVPHIACFDTAFHRDLPPVARMLPIPRRLLAAGIERYGFHGLSYSHLLSELRNGAGDNTADGRLVLAHLGNGVSLTAVHNGRSMDTTMGLTPAAGVPMGTRSGDLDPGLVRHLAETEGMDAAAFDRMVNHESGLLGVSGSSSDLRDLLAREQVDQFAAEAVALFCYRIRMAIGALAAALGGMDVLVFTGGIGEHSAAIRNRICDGLGFLGLRLDEVRNEAGAGVISEQGSRVSVRVIATDEEVVMARAAAEILQRRDKGK